MVSADRSVCREPVLRGTCDDSILSYYYDSNTERCREFVYSGCDGNGNRFSKISQCRATCMSTTTTDEGDSRGDRQGE